MERKTAAAEAVQRVQTLAERAQPLVERVQGWRPVRVLQRFADRDGPLLAAGMSYQAVFAIFAAIWVAFAVAGIWVRANPAIYEALLDILEEAVPGLVGTHGVIQVSDLNQASVTLTVTASVALVGLVWTAVGWLGSTRTAIRSMFGLGKDPRNFFVQKLVDAAQALAFGVGLIVAATLSVTATQLLQVVFVWFGLGPHSPAEEVSVQAVSLVVVFLVNSATLAGMYRLLSRVYIPRRHLMVGAGLGGLALTVLSILSGLVIGGASRNPLLASFAAFVGLLIWFNFVCQVILIGATWIAVAMEDRGISPRKLTAEEAQLERARAEFRARLEQATEAARAATAAYTAANGWLSRRRARRVLLERMHELQLVRASDPDGGPQCERGEIALRATSEG
ncbi:YihY/virulence factor BrkB family protein [Gryllotalpicola ginsengisoli]|uniref:YihY/virulence factor BrkB family protein n=1 Tax=Gryllotalpicola ginsengisoli TaxID=444608 RepID=UPI0003B39DCC|nr:YihY/virulence factor BrkB family protein [Gryllotalpicola ginsengisoli]